MSFTLLNDRCLLGDNGYCRCWLALYVLCSEDIELSVTFNGEHIYGSPFYPSVLPAPTASGHCKIGGEGRDIAIVGQTNEFTITAFDQWDDARGVGKID